MEPTVEPEGDMRPASEGCRTGAPDRPARGRGAVSFVAIFLVLTVTLLTLARLTVNTGPVNWYLFEVARNTAWVLGFCGHSSEVEDSEMYRNRAAEVRAALTGSRGGDPAGAIESGSGSESPLTPWEIWQYRSLLLARQAQQTKAGVVLTECRARPSLESDAERLAFLRQELNRLVASTRQDNFGGAVRVTAPQLDAIIAASEETLGVLERSGAPPGAPLGPMLDRLEAQIEAGIEQQHVFLQATETQLAVRMHDHHGPIVSFVARAGLATQLKDAQAEQKRIMTGSSPYTLDNKARVGALAARIDALTAARDAVKDPAQLAALDKDQRFQFNLVPDCGALPSMAIFLAAMLAFPTGMRKRLTGLVIGLPLLYLINIARLTCLALIGAYADNREVFEFAHEYVWQAVYIVFVVIVWLMWVEFIVRPRATKMKTPSPTLPADGEGAGWAREGAGWDGEVAGRFHRPQNGEETGSPPVHGGS